MLLTGDSEVSQTVPLCTLREILRYLLFIVFVNSKRYFCETMKPEHDTFTTKGNRQTHIQMHSSIKYRLDKLLHNIHNVKKVIRLRENYIHLFKNVK